MSDHPKLTLMYMAPHQSPVNVKKNISVKIIGKFSSWRRAIIRMETDNSAPRDMETRRWKQKIDREMNRGGAIASIKQNIKCWAIYKESSSITHAWKRPINHHRLWDLGGYTFKWLIYSNAWRTVMWNEEWYCNYPDKSIHCICTEIANHHIDHWHPYISGSFGKSAV